METVLIAIGTLIPMLLVLVVVHELGHYATARLLGVKVVEFAVGFPPRALSIYTGKTRVLIDPLTRFVNAESLADLRPGQFIKVHSTEDTHGNLVARIIEASLPGPRSGGRAEAQESETVQAADDWLRHDGKVKAVEPGGGSFMLADMRYSLNWTPIGGFVRMAGENNPAVPRSLASKGPGTRFLILVAGPLMNVILPIVVLAILFMIPQEVTVGRVAAAEVPAGSPVAEAGLRPGDIVVEAGGHTIETRSDLVRAVNLNGGGAMEWLIDRGGNQEVITVRPRFEPSPGRWIAGLIVGGGQAPGEVAVLAVLDGSAAEAAGLMEGDVIRSAANRAISQPNDLPATIQGNEGAPMEWRIVREGREQVISVTPRLQQPGEPRWRTGLYTTLVDPRTVSRSDPPWKAIPQGFVGTWESLLLMKQAISGAVSSGSAPEFSGPVGIAQLTGEVTVEAGITGWLAIAVLLSINLAILNILPIPALDGGRIVFVVLEWVRRGKRVPPEKEGLVHLAGFGFLITAILAIMASDINRVISGGSLLGG